MVMISMAKVAIGSAMPRSRTRARRQPARRGRHARQYRRAPARVAGPRGAGRSSRTSFAPASVRIADVAAHRHERDMAEGEDARIADEDEQADHDDQLDQCLDDRALQAGAAKLASSATRAGSPISSGAVARGEVERGHAIRRAPARPCSPAAHAAAREGTRRTTGTRRHRGRAGARPADRPAAYRHDPDQKSAERRTGNRAHAATTEATKAISTMLTPIL